MYEIEVMIDHFNNILFIASAKSSNLRILPPGTNQKFFADLLFLKPRRYLLSLFFIIKSIEIN